MFLNEYLKLRRKWKILDTFHIVFHQNLQSYV